MNKEARARLDASWVRPLLAPLKFIDVDIDVDVVLAPERKQGVCMVKL